MGGSRVAVQTLHTLLPSVSRWCGPRGRASAGWGKQQTLFTSQSWRNSKSESRVRAPPPSTRRSTSRGSRGCACWALSRGRRCKSGRLHQRWVRRHQTPADAQVHRGAVDDDEGKVCERCVQYPRVSQLALLEEQERTSANGCNTPCSICFFCSSFSASSTLSGSVCGKSSILPPHSSILVPGTGRKKLARSSGLSLRNWRTRSCSQLKPSYGASLAAGKGNAALFESAGDGRM